MKRGAMLALALVVALTDQAIGVKESGQSASSVRPARASTVFDFGHVGIDYIFHHRYAFVNRTSDTVRILKVAAHCDCSNAAAAHAVLPPGDSTTINLRFNTKNFYGPQSKSITVITDHPLLDSIEFYYLSIIEQWFGGIRPEPKAAFFLPVHKSQIIRIPNPVFDAIEIASIFQLDDYYTVKPLISHARKNEAIELEIVPSASINKGTHHSNITVTVKSGSENPILLTIPIKIVRY